jgi:hypothetical protein
VVRQEVVELRVLQVHLVLQRFIKQHQQIHSH